MSRCSTTPSPTFLRVEEIVGVCAYEESCARTLVSAPPAVSRATYVSCAGSDDDGGKGREVDAAAWGKIKTETSHSEEGGEI